MSSENVRAHGVTPGLSSEYAFRTSSVQAAFILPYLRAGMNLLDVGCGPGSITVGLAQAVSPGHVTGLDHDATHLDQARALADVRQVNNVTFQNGNALSLPFEPGTFDAAFENNVLGHLARNAVLAVREVHRVLAPGGFLAARDADASAVIWGQLTDPIREFDELFRRWHTSRGSDIDIGRTTPTILRQAGFVGIIKSVSADTKGSPEDVKAHAEIMVHLLNGSFGRDIVNNGWADEVTVERLRNGARQWGPNPDAFFANVHVEVIGWKPG